MAKNAEAAPAAQDALLGQQANSTVRIAQLERAFNNMPLALCMFDAHHRLVVCNSRYADLFALPPALTLPGTPLLDILQYRAASDSPQIEEMEAYIRSRLEILVRGDPFKSVLELKSGQVLSVVYEPMAGGGWVATHEDITEQTRIDRELESARRLVIEARNEAERALEKARIANQLLLEAFEVVPEALALFDGQGRFVIWNKKYEELYQAPIGLRVGMTFEESLRIALAYKQFPAAVGREEAWLSERLEHHAAPQSRNEHELAGGRWVRVEERRTRDGGSLGIRVNITDLKRRQESFRLLFEGNPIPMWVYDHETLQFLAVNDAAVEHYGYSREAFLAMTILDIRPEEDRPLITQSARVALNKGRTRRHIIASGDEILVATYGRSIPYDGKNARLIAVVDVTERTRVGDELRRVQEFLKLVIESVPEAIFVKDAQTKRFTLLNRAAEEFLGIWRADIVGKTVGEIYPAEFAAEIIKRDEQLVEIGESSNDSVLFETTSKGSRLVNIKRKLLRNAKDEPEYFLTVIEDITDRKRAEERVAYLALHDPLTDLPNRAAFNEQLKSVVNSATDADERLALLSIDVDRLNEVNDIFGYAGGDQLLSEVARRLSASSGENFLARTGGGEFALIVENCDPPSLISELTDRLLAEVGTDLNIEDGPIRVGLSIGVAIFPDDGQDGKTLLANADAARYRAKAEGRGRARFFKIDVDTRLRERHSMRHDLSLAIERGELAMFYQPQARVTGAIVGFEALIRWRHPSRGSVPPDTFIAIAEESELIIRIGEWVLRDVCREAASWSSHPTVSVNLSPVQFRHGDLPDLIQSILSETGLSPQRLEVEITEGVLIDDSARTLSVLHRLKALGVRIAMDDFGKGYSSLSYLQLFPFDKIKIDRAFINNVQDNPQSQAIVRAVLGLAHGLALPVVAEGVETVEELEFLAKEGCDFVQGYLIGRPLPIKDYSALTAEK